MPGIAIIGAQWGDEGKGKVVDALASEADFVVRYSGGANAGHTVVAGEDVFKLHHLPCGVLHDRPISIFGQRHGDRPLDFSARIRSHERALRGRSALCLTRGAPGFASSQK